MSQEKIVEPKREKEIVEKPGELLGLLYQACLQALATERKKLIDDAGFESAFFSFSLELKMDMMDSNFDKSLKTFTISGLSEVHNSIEGYE